MRCKELRRKTILPEVGEGRKNSAGIVSIVECVLKEPGNQRWIHRNRGRNRIPRLAGVDQRRQVPERCGQRHAGYVPSFASEKLKADGLRLDHGAPRRCYRKKACGVDSDGSGPHLQRLARRRRWGELVPMEGSRHVGRATPVSDQSGQRRNAAAVGQVKESR